MIIPVREVATFDEFVDVVLEQNLKCVRIDQIVDQDELRNAVIAPDGTARAKVNHLFTTVVFKDGGEPGKPAESESILMYVFKVDDTAAGIELKRKCDWLEVSLGVSMLPGRYFPEMYDVEAIEKLQDMMRNRQQTAAAKNKIITPN
jgi:hypothetical protein